MQNMVVVAGVLGFLCIIKQTNEYKSLMNNTKWEEIIDYDHVELAPDKNYNIDTYRKSLI